MADDKQRKDHRSGWSPEQHEIHRRLIEVLASHETGDGPIDCAATSWLCVIADARDTINAQQEICLMAPPWSPGLDSDFCRRHRTALLIKMNLILRGSKLKAYRRGVCIAVADVRDVPEPVPERETTMAEILGRVIADDVKRKAEDARDEELRRKGFTQQEINRAFYSAPEAPKDKGTSEVQEPSRKPTRGWLARLAALFGLRG
jgi:hypothetical protein